MQSHHQVWTCVRLYHRSAVSQVTVRRRKLNQPLGVNGSEDFKSSMDRCRMNTCIIYTVANMQISPASGVCMRSSVGFSRPSWCVHVHSFFWSLECQTFPDVKSCGRTWKKQVDVIRFLLNLPLVEHAVLSWKWRLMQNKCWRKQIEPSVCLISEEEQEKETAWHEIVCITIELKSEWDV